MKIAVLGTGVVGRTIAVRLLDLGHEIAIGTRDVDATMARTEPDRYGNPPFPTWHADHAAISLTSYSGVASDVDVVVNATPGGDTLTALGAVGNETLDGTVVLDISNGLDVSLGFPPSLLVANTDSIAEQIQRAYPAARVVKTLNTVTAAVMVDPAALGDATQVFLSGDDDAAKQTVRDLLRSFGWPDDTIIDLGGIKTARGTEMYVTLWIDLMVALGTQMFNVKIVKA